MLRFIFSSETKLVNLAEIEFLYQEEKKSFNIYLVNIYWVLSMCQRLYEQYKVDTKRVISYEYYGFKVMCVKSVTLCYILTAN